MFHNQFNNEAFFFCLQLFRFVGLLKFRNDITKWLLCLISFFLWQMGCCMNAQFSATVRIVILKQSVSVFGLLPELFSSVRCGQGSGGQRWCHIQQRFKIVMTLVLFFFLCCQATCTEKKKFTCTVLVKQNRLFFVFCFSYFLTNEQECSSCRFITSSIHPTVSLSCLLFKKVLGWLELEPILVDFGCNRNTQVKVNSKYIILCGLYYKPSE